GIKATANIINGDDGQNDPDNSGLVDQANVYLAYSTNSGDTWTELDQFSFQVVDGSWQRIKIEIPEAAQTGLTQFRWSQPSYYADSVLYYDDWAIDNVAIVQNSSDVWLDISGGKVLRAQQESGDNLIDISDGEALYFTADAFDISNPLGVEFQYLLRNYDAQLITGDFNGDGKTDFVRRQNRAWSYDNYLFTTYLSEGDGNYTVVETPESISQPIDDNDFDAIVHTGDFNGDGITDFIRQNREANSRTDTNYNFVTYLGTSDGTFDRVRPTGSTGGYDYRTELLGNPGVNIITGDYDGDGKTDFIRQEKGAWDGDDTKTFSVWFSNGDGTFSVT
ncbi:MAG: FG-GAP-like repeat-containing protein, partial [Prochlorotrichaceae cyanobacterium]